LDIYEVGITRKMSEIQKEEWLASSNVMTTKEKSLKELKEKKKLTDTERIKEYFNDLKRKKDLIPQQDKQKTLVNLLKNLFKTKVSSDLLEKCLNDKHKIVKKITNVAEFL